MKSINFLTRCAVRRAQTATRATAGPRRVAELPLLLYSLEGFGSSTAAAECAVTGNRYIPRDDDEVDADFINSIFHRRRLVSFDCRS